jgi:hypothetical protein
MLAFVIGSLALWLEINHGIGMRNEDLLKQTGNDIKMGINTQ